MKRIRTNPNWIILCCLVLTSQVAIATVGEATGNGNWRSSHTWLFNGIERIPGCGDTLHIGFEYAVTVNAQENYTSCQEPMMIIVAGILQFTNGNKLDLPDGSTVQILTGGMVRKITPGGGNSTLISICGAPVWAARNGDLYGPRTLICLALPVTYVALTAEPLENAVRISWSTATELNNDFFRVEKSTDGESFQMFNSIPGAGTSSVQLDYTCIDEHPVNGVNYYRIAQVDYDGMANYSHVIALKMKGMQSISVYPNPTNAGAAAIRYSGDRVAYCDVAIIDLQGRPVFEKIHFMLEPGSNPIGLPDGHFSSGTYLVSIRMYDEEVHQKLVIRNDNPDAISAY